MSELAVDGLRVQRRDGGAVIHDVSLRIPLGRSLGIIGESGSGKSLTLRAIAGLLPGMLTAANGVVRVGAEELRLPNSPQRVAAFARTARIAMIFQDPSMALDPLMRIGRQLGEVVRRHHPRRGETRRAVAQLLADVELPPELEHRFPHEISGGQRQRIVIALALATDPRILFCDEPTTALDVTVQARILELLRRLQRERDLTLVFVSHDLPVVASLCDRIAVMRDGRIVEAGATAQVIDAPRDAVTRMLVTTARQAEAPLLALRQTGGPS